MATVFSDNFETNDYTNWTSTTVSQTGSAIATATGAVKNGTYGSQATVSNAGSTSGEAQARKDFTNPASNIVVLDAWTRFSSFTTAGLGSAISKAVMEIHGNNVGQENNPFYRMAHINVVGTRVLQLAYKDKAGTGQLVTGTVTLTLNTWYLLRLIVDKSGTNPVLTFKYSTDGTTFTQVSTVTDSAAGSDGTGRTPGVIHVGVVHMGQFEAMNYVVQQDDVALYDAEPSGAVAIPNKIIQTNWAVKRAATW